MSPSNPPAQVLQTAPTLRVGASLDFIADSPAVGGREAFLESCRLSEDSRVQEFVTLADASPSESLQDLCTKSGLTVPSLIGIVLASHVISQNNLALWQAASGRPAVMAASIASALIPGAEGFADRQLQLKMGGLVPKEGGINIINQMQVGVRATGIPGFEERARMTTEAVRGDLQLPSSSDINPTDTDLEVPDIP